ncbi:hypothetical protein HK100_006012 [Physocladia obscura]|uniref:Exocyst complex component Sec3 PIP2-binding N-terminal domain-containing protein n=1 Tax=Physocladia obscura TaxID=109957 RepID=A0AAD5ST03_9FUNG|nr:hypothetical protein HK100_006012 [Physocladia obscura]
MSKEEDNGIVLNARIAEYDDERALNVALAAGVSGDAKIRYITITAVKKKVKIHKTKEKGATSTFGLGKSWGLDDIESIEPFKGNAVCIHLGSKAYYWILDSPHNKIELMHTMVTLSQTHLNKIPKLIKIDEELLKGPVPASNA